MIGEDDKALLLEFAHVRADMREYEEYLEETERIKQKARASIEAEMKH